MQSHSCCTYTDTLWPLLLPRKYTLPLYCYLLPVGKSILCPTGPSLRCVCPFWSLALLFGGRPPLRALLSSGHVAPETVGLVINDMAEVRGHLAVL